VSPRLGEPTGPTRARPSVAVLAPAPLLTVTIEASPSGDEVHLHPGGQGVWIARLVANLEIDVVLCGTFGGESGLVALGLLERMWDLRVRAVAASGPNGAYVHDRRSGERVPVAEVEPAMRVRHEVDELYGTLFVAGLEADVVVLGGPESPRMQRGAHHESIPFDVYRRLPVDLHRNDVTVVADLSGAALDAAADGAVDVLKVSDEELLLDGRIADRTVDSILVAMQDLAARGVRSVVVTRAGDPSMALVEGAAYEIESPRMEPVDDRGAGDSVTAGISAGLARGQPVIDAVRLGAAAGALNVARRGFGSGSRREIEALARHVTIKELR
jgi:1-phosphofructokinase